MQICQIQGNKKANRILFASNTGLRNSLNSQTIYGRLVETLEPYFPYYIDALIFNFYIVIIA